MVVFGTLLPLGTNLSNQIQRKKERMHAAETAFHAAILYTNYGIATGRREIDLVQYSWMISDDTICVTTDHVRKEIIKCIDL